VSEANSGDESPKRPEMNAERVGDGGSNSSEHPPKKKSRRRWRRRPKRSETGIRAETSNSNASQTGEPVGAHKFGTDIGAETAVGADNPAAASGTAATGDETAIGAAKDSKRRRRRRRRHRGRSANKSDEVQLSNTTAETSGTTTDLPQSSDTGSNNPDNETKHHRRADRRRNRRRLPADNFGKDQSQAGEAGEAGGQVASSNGSNSSTQGKTGRSERRQPRHWGDAYAALDLGTNNCRLLVAVPQQPGRFKVVDAFSRIVRLGEGLVASGELREEAMDRAIGALKMCAGKLKNRRVKGVRLIATEACRRASNGEEFLRRVENQTGIKLEIIDRETEARLAVAGCSSLVDRRAKGVVLFDIGGGSSELALLDLDKRRRHDLGPAMVSWTSLPLGVVTLSEKHGGGRVVTRPIFENMVDDVSELLMQFEGRDALQSVSERGEVHLLGTSGTVTTLAGIHLNLPRYDRRRVDGIWMNSDDVDAMIYRLVDMSFEQRAANPCIGYDRADLVLAGCAILVAIQRLWPCPRLRVADRGLREGLLTEMMNADNAWQRRPRYYRHKRN